jgi:hypothetical protein
MLGSISQHCSLGIKQDGRDKKVIVVYEFAYTFHLQVHLKPLITRGDMLELDEHSPQILFVATTDNVVMKRHLCRSKEGSLKRPLHAPETPFKRARKGGGVFITRARH